MNKAVSQAFNSLALFDFVDIELVPKYAWGDMMVWEQALQLLLAWAEIVYPTR